MKSTHPFIIAAASFAIATSGYAAQLTGPSSSASPYVIASNPANTTVTSILTVGDSVNNKPDGVTPYRMVGIPDGLGAYDNNDGTFTVLMNHELQGTAGVTRAHGAAGSFVSKWIINKNTFAAVNGSDLIQNVSTWSTITSTYNAPATGVVLSRLCSADLAAPSAYYNTGTGNGTQNRIFMSGEEIGPEGRAFGHVVTGPSAGTSYELPRLGKFSWENGVANPGTGDKTVVLGTDDATPGQVYMYVGTKTNSGSDVQKAGLTNGSLYGIKAGGVNPDRFESRTTGFDGASGNKDSVPFTLQSLGNVENTTGAALQLNSANVGVTEFLRPEDITWDQNDVTKAYFVTTDRFDTGATVGASRLWEMDFADVNDFTLGGTLKMLIEGTGGADGQMFDNLTMTSDGQLILQEDPGNQGYLAKTWSFDLADGTLTELLVSDSDRFVLGNPGFLTQDEENSGVIEITNIINDPSGQKYYLGVTQAHYGIAGELVEGGQMYVTAVPEPGTYALFGLSALGLGGFIRHKRRKATL